jgi:hypothetical protein
MLSPTAAPKMQNDKDRAAVNHIWTGPVAQVVGADGGKRPISPLYIEIIDEFSSEGPRFVACFVALGTIGNTFIRRSI